MTRLPFRTSPPRQTGLLVFVASILLAWLIAQSVLGGSLMAALRPLAWIAGLAAVIAAVLRWRFGLLVLMVWLTLEDLPRKYGGNDMRLFFAKYILGLAVYAGFILERRRRPHTSWRPAFVWPLLAFFALAFVQVFNPRSPSFAYGILGLSLYFFFAPLALVGYEFAGNADDLRRLLRLLFTMAAVIAAVGIVQASGWRTFLNPPALAPELQSLGQLARYIPGLRKTILAPPSVFVSQARYMGFIGLVLTVLLGALATNAFEHRPNRALYGLLALLGAAVYLGGSKGTLIYSLLTVLGMSGALLWGMRNRPWLGQRVARILRRGLIVLVLGLIALAYLFPNLTRLWASYYYQMLWPDSPRSVLVFRTQEYPLNEWLKALHTPGVLWGYGTGVASLGVQYIVRLLGASSPPVTGVENGFGCLLMELGLLGPLLWVLWTTTLLIAGWRRTRWLAATSFYPLGFSILWYSFWLLLPITWGGLNTYQNYVINAYFWLLAGILFRLPELAAGEALVSSVPSEWQHPEQVAGAARWR
jgi:hypothetical protein